MKRLGIILLVIGLGLCVVLPGIVLIYKFATVANASAVPLAAPTVLARHDHEVKLLALAGAAVSVTGVILLVVSWWRFKATNFHE